MFLSSIIFAIPSEKQSLPIDAMSNIYTIFLVPINNRFMSPKRSMFRPSGTKEITFCDLTSEI